MKRILIEAALRIVAAVVLTLALAAMLLVTAPIVLAFGERGGRALGRLID